MDGRRGGRGVRGAGVSARGAGRAPVRARSAGRAPVSARSAGDGAEALRVALRAEGGTLAQSVVDRVERVAEPGPAQVAASGPRATGHEAEYELLIEMILEGS